MGDYPKPSYHFTVEWGGTRVEFVEVSGLNITVDITELRMGTDPDQAPRKMPGLTHYSNIILKRGIVNGDNDFFNWINTIRMSTVERRDIVIKLLDENHQPFMSWKAKNSFPVRVSGPILNAHANCVAIEEIEITHEGLIIEMN